MCECISHRVVTNFKSLRKLHLVLLAVLELLVEEMARLLIALVLLQAIKKHGLVRRARFGRRNGGCRRLHGTGRIVRSGGGSRLVGAATITREGIGHGTHGAMRNRRTRSKGHALDNGTSNTR
jgi:hypothetical protein